MIGSTCSNSRIERVRVSSSSFEIRRGLAGPGRRESMGTCSMWMLCLVPKRKAPFNSGATVGTLGGTMAWARGLRDPDSLLSVHSSAWSVLAANGCGHFLRLAPEGLDPWRGAGSSPLRLPLQRPEVRAAVREIAFVHHFEAMTAVERQVALPRGIQVAGDSVPVRTGGD